MSMNETLLCKHPERTELAYFTPYCCRDGSADQFLAPRLDSSQHPVTPIQGTCYPFLASVGTCIYVRYSNTNTHTYTAKNKNNIFKILYSEGMYIMKISS